MNPPPTLTVDLLVAGAGITGLYVATRYLQKNPTHKLILVERNSYLGGRVYTHHQHVKGKGQYQWEAGAGRIPVSHKRVIGLIKEYGLTFQRWEAPKNLVEAPARMAGPTSAISLPKDPFPDLIPVFLEPLKALPPAVLGQHTLADLLQELHGSVEANRFMKLFPYWAEFHTLRADVALDAFLEGPLGPKIEGWGGCAEGLSALVERMGTDVEARGSVVQKGVSVLEVKQIDLRSSGRDQGMRVLLENNGKRYYVDAKNVVLALDAVSLRKVKGVGHLPVLKQLKSEPLLRTYAVFPVGGDKSWFSGMAKEVVPGPIRFFIPMDATKGLAMISYTEGRDAEYWMRMPVKKREHAVMKALRELYPEKEIPDPLFVKFHGWESGCTYWLPNNYQTEEESAKSIQPLGGLPLYLCSESFAVQQSWMESGLVQAEQVLRKLGGL